MKRHLHISIGPVQDFIGQSRRTRDLWGSSYLLSFLAAHAMSGATRAKGRVVRPQVKGDAMMSWVDGHGQGEPPKLGSLPNRFTIEIEANVDPGGVAKAAEESLRTAWKRVCDAVWGRYVVQAVGEGKDTAVIWQRQIQNFWEVTWVIGLPEDHDLLARRKLWHTHWLPQEAGDKCTVMTDLQELSGHVRATDGASRKRQDAFWNIIRTQTGMLDIRENERLCAVALVKRLYPGVSRDALGWDVHVKNWPSTVDVAAAPWADRALDGAPDESESFAAAVLSATDRNHALMGGVSTLVDRNHSTSTPFLRLDANWFHRSFAANPKLAPLSEEGARTSVLAGLEALTNVAGSPPIYFALLLADGDRLGGLVSSLGSSVVSDKLATFTRDVPNIVSRHRGVTVYAGGDDVLALLPLESALECASDIEKAYREPFGPTLATLSAAIVFSHARDPLNGIVAEAHRLLDEVAKEQNGRASVAASVYRGGVAAVQWATTWERTSPDGTRKDAVKCLSALVREHSSERAGFSASLLQDLRHMLALVCGLPSMAPGTFSEVTEEINLEALIRAEVVHRLSHQKGEITSGYAEHLATLLDGVLGRSHREETAQRQVGIDGLLLANFLAGGGQEEEHRP